MRIISTKLASYLMAIVLTMTTIGLPMAANARSYSSYDYMADSEEPTGGTMMAELLMRPFMLVGTVLTTATFIVTSPFSALGGNFGDAFDTLVKEPAAYTFTRPLGEL